MKSGIFLGEDKKLQDIRKIRVLVIFVSNGLIMGAVSENMFYC